MPSSSQSGSDASMLTFRVVTSQQATREDEAEARAIVGEYAITTNVAPWGFRAWIADTDAYRIDSLRDVLLPLHAVIQDVEAEKSGDD